MLRDARIKDSGSVASVSGFSPDEDAAFEAYKSSFVLPQVEMGISVESVVGGKAAAVATVAEQFYVDSEVEDYWGHHGKFALSGSGEVTNSDPLSKKMCGKIYGFTGCIRTESHNLTTLMGENYRGKGLVYPVHRSCFRTSCPRCYRSYAVREAKRACARLKASEKVNGKIYHAVLSPPKSAYALYDTDYEAAREVAQKVAVSRGLNGGLFIFHGFRYHSRKEAKEKNVPFGWVWSVHWHYVGHLAKAYACYGCSQRNLEDRVKCWECPEFDGVVRRKGQEDGWIVKMEDDRRSIYGTVYYACTHLAYQIDAKRAHPVTWWGVCSYRQLKVSPEDMATEDTPRVCEICGADHVRLRYMGFDKKFQDSWWVKKWVVNVYDVDGLPLWVEKSGGGSECWREGG